MPVHWKRLDLRCKNTMPPLNTLAALCLRPVNGRAVFYRSEQYEIGRFQRESDDRRGKVWWHSSRGVNDPARMRKHYDIWWCPIPNFDGF